MHPRWQTIHLLSWRCWSGWRPSLSSLCASLQTFCHDRRSWWVIILWRPTHSSFTDTLPHRGLVCHNLRTGRSCSDGFAWHGWSPFFLTLYLTHLQHLNDNRSFVQGVAFGCFGLGLIGPFFHGLALLPHPNSYRAFVPKMCCLLFGRGFLPPVTSIGDRNRREGFPSWGLPTYGLNHGVKTLRHICTISSSSMLTLIDPRESHNSLIFKV